MSPGEQPSLVPGEPAPDPHTGSNSRAAQIGHQTTQCRLIPFLPARRVEEHDLPAGQSRQGHLIGLRLKIIEVPYHPLMPDRQKDIPPRETPEALASLPCTSVF